MLIHISQIEQGVVLYTDVHGHSRMKNMFMYGCTSTESAHHRTNAIIRGFPLLFGQACKFADYGNCKFANEKGKEATARMVVFKEMGILNTYTLEASFYGADCKYK